MNEHVENASAARETAVSALPATRPLYWSIRRELWENRSIYLAPLIVAAVVLFASLINVTGLPKKVRALAASGGAEQHEQLVKSFGMAPAPIMLATFLVALFYSIDALYGERRDRSILFWKSLPVSDRTTVLAKASVPLVLLPAIAYVLSVAVVLVMVLYATSVLLVNGLSPAPVLRELSLGSQLIIMFYGLAVHALWFAPIYCWLLLLSVWARRMPALWAALPPLVLLMMERMVSTARPLSSLLKYRLVGGMSEGFTTFRQPAGDSVVERLSELTPLRFLSAPGLWVGLGFAAVCVFTAVRQRRKREPI